MPWRSSVLKSDNEHNLAKRVMEIETIIYPHSIAAIMSGKVNLINGNWNDGSIDEDFPQLDFHRSYRHPLFKAL